MFNDEFCKTVHPSSLLGAKRSPRNQGSNFNENNLLQRLLRALRALAMTMGRVSAMTMGRVSAMTMGRVSAMTMGRVSAMTIGRGFAMTKSRGFAMTKMAVLMFIVGCFLIVSPAFSQTPNFELRTSNGETVLSLEDSVRYAVSNSYEVRMAKLDLYIAETDLMYSEAVFDTFFYGGLGYSEDKRQQVSVFSPDDSQGNEYYGGIETKLPTGTELSAELKDSRSWDNSAFVSKNPSHEGSLTLTAVQPVGQNILGYVDRSQITLTRLAIENTGLDTKDRIEDVAARTEKAYLELAFAKRSLEIYQDMLEKAKKLYATQEKNYAMGLSEKVDLLATEANLAISGKEVLIAENYYNKKEEDLKLIINIEEIANIVLSDELRVFPVEESLDECFEKAFLNRRDYEIKKRDVEIKGLDLKVKENLKWPEIDLTVSLEMNGLERDFQKAMGKTTVLNNTYYYAGVEFRLPIENSAAQSENMKAGHEKEKALVALKEVERAIITEISNMFGDVTSFKGGLVYLRKAVELQTEKLTEEESRFSRGRSNTKRIIDYQQDLLRAELEEVQLLLSYNKARVDLARAMNVILAKYEDLL